ncbi:MAG: hypothetical protein H7Y17_14135 [Chlorobia bacterium]|nr:hypothetical protein [Fimbriimonadaceae bacterium]
MSTKYIPILALILAIGCKPSPDVATVTENPSSTTAGKDGQKPEAPKPKPEDIPASVKHNAYEYYGLGNLKPMGLEMRSPNLPSKTGGVTAELEKIEGGRVYFQIVRTGAIAEDLGDDTVIVDADGVHMAGTTIGTITPTQFLALPADLTPGKTWKVDNKVVKKDGQAIEEKSTYKVEGIRDLKTKSGVQKALLVTSVGRATVSMAGTKQESKYETKSWFVKGIGNVKIEIALTTPGKPTQTMIVEQSS